MIGLSLRRKHEQSAALSASNSRYEKLSPNFDSALSSSRADVQEAANLSMQGSKRAPEAWLRLLKSCETQRQAAALVEKQVATNSLSDSENCQATCSAIAALLRSKDWASIRVVQENLPPGKYDEGRVRCDRDTLILTLSDVGGERLEVGLKKNTLPDEFFYCRGDRYEGEIRNGQCHGWGAYYPGEFDRPKRVDHGIFIENTFKGNPHKPNATIYSRLQRLISAQ